METYLNRFERYCEENLRGDRSFWIDELESRLTGETLNAFGAMKDVEDTYDKLKDKLIDWYKAMDDLRKKQDP